MLAALTAACVLGHVALLTAWDRLADMPRSKVSWLATPVEVRWLTVPSPVPLPVGAVEAGLGTRPTIVATPPVSTRPAAPVDSRLDGRYWPTRDLDMPPQPRGEPDEQMLEGAQRSGQPILVRLLIESDGSIVDAQLVAAMAGDEATAQRVVAMLRQTAFTPGRRQGGDVPSFLDVEVVLDPQPPPLPILPALR